MNLSKECLSSNLNFKTKIVTSKNLSRILMSQGWNWENPIATYQNTQVKWSWCQRKSKDWMKLFREFLKIVAKRSLRFNNIRFMNNRLKENCSKIDEKWQIMRIKSRCLDRKSKDLTTHCKTRYRIWIILSYNLTALNMSSVKQDTNFKSAKVIKRMKSKDQKGPKIKLKDWPKSFAQMKVK